MISPIIYFTLLLPSHLTLDLGEIDLPQDHLPFYFSTYPAPANNSNPNLTVIQPTKCWGYESECAAANRYSTPDCPGDHKGWVRTKEDQQNTFYTQADFGFVRQQLREMKLLCAPLFQHDSVLECSEHLQFCRGRNIMVNFTSLVERSEPLRYKMDVLAEGNIGGYCEFNKSKLMEEADHISPLQSWGPELRYFTKLRRRPIEGGDCDVVVDKPTFIMKIDALNMYHHFCDFLNLYASLHLNSSHPGAFSTDVHIMIWETYTYYSAFESAFDAFTVHPLWNLNTFRGKTVCFKNLVLPLLPRMIFGLYYNTPIIYGCQSSGLFHAFSLHLLHRLRIREDERKNRKIRIRLLSRDTKYRTILNEDELIEALKRVDEYEIERVVYNKDVDFKRQLEITRNSDVFIGMHGAGLTHLLFLPDWAAVFELYHCEDPNCYGDLARLRGIKYITWENPEKLVQQDQGNHPQEGAHAKFTNYSFDVEEFLRLVKECARHVREHPKFEEKVSRVKNEGHNEL